MAQPILPVSAQAEINGLYVALYDVPATLAGFNFWLSVLQQIDPTITSAAAYISTADAQALGIQMTANAPVVNGTTYFATLYPTSLTDTNFVQALYQNTAGFQGTGPGIQFWTTQLATLEAGGDTVIQAREAIAGNFVEAFLQNNLSLGAAFWSLGQSDFNALVAGQQALLNKVSVSEYWAANSTADNGLLNYTFANLSPPSGPFLAGMKLINSVNSNPSSLSAAQAAINLAISSNSLTPPPPPSVMQLTVPGETIALTGTTGAITLSGADLTSYPAAGYGTVALAEASGITSVNSTSTDNLSARGNAAATSYNFGTGIVSGADSIDATLTYTGFTTYIASNHGDMVTLSAAGQSVTGGTGGDAVNFGGLAATGTTALGSGANIVQVQGANISGLTYSDTGAAALQITSSGTNNETMTAAEYNDFNTKGITLTGGATAAQTTITLTTLESGTLNAAVGAFVLGNFTNSVTLGAAGQSVTGGTGNDTVAFGSLTPTGTIALGTGTNHVAATVGGDLSGATITAAGGTADLTLSADGTETLNTAAYNLFSATGITFIGAAGPSNDTIMFSNAATATDVATVGNYILGNFSNNFTVSNNAADNVTGGTGNDTVAFGSLTPTGTIALGAGANHVTATVGGDLGGATITATGGTADLTLSADGTETLSTAEYNLFSATGITFIGAAGPSNDTIVFSNAATATDVAAVGNYILGNFSNNFTVSNNAADNVTGGTGNDTVAFGSLTPTGTIALGTGTNHVTATVGGDLSGATITAAGGTADLTLSADGTETLNTAAYNLFSATGITFIGAAGPSNDTIVFSNAATATDVATVGNYILGNFSNDFTVSNNAADNVTGGTGNDTVAFGSLTPTGTIALGAGANHVTATVGGDLGGATITATGGTADLTLSADGTETLSTAEYNLFSATGITFTGTAGPSNDKIVFSNAGTVNVNSNVQNYTLAGDDAISISTGTATIAIGGSGNSIINQGGTYTLTDNGSNNTFVLPLSGQGVDTVNGNVLTNGDTFDLRAAMAATTWDQQSSDLGNYLTIGTQGGNALVQISDTSGGTPHTVAVLDGLAGLSLSSFVAHALLT